MSQSFSAEIAGCREAIESLSRKSPLLMAKVFAIVGRSGSGKTTLIVALLKELKARGLRVVTIKHSHHLLDNDKPNSDTDKHRHAGAEVTALLMPNGCVIRSSEELSVDRLIEMMSPNHDYVILEGFKSSHLRKIEVVRGQEPVLEESEVWLTVSDSVLGRAHEAALDDIEGLADKLEAS